MPITKQWPSGATNATPTSYSLPLNNELNWLQLTSFLQALADSAQGTTFAKFKVRVITASPDTVSATADCILAVNVSGAATINLPAGAEKQIFFITDASGAAATNNITITPNGSETVRGSASLVLNKNYQGVVLAFTGTDWKAFGPFTTPGSITDADFTGQLTTAKGGTGQNSSATFPTSGTVATVPAAGVVKSSGTALTSSNVNLASEVTGTLPIANGGTGITSFGTGVQTALGQNVTGSGSIALANAPTITGIPTFTSTALMTSIYITPTNGTGYIQLAEQSSSVATANSNTCRIYVKTDNNLYLKDELGIEYPVGGQFTYILNSISNPSESDNWAVTGGAVSTTQTTAQLPLTPVIGSAIRFVPTSNTQYVRYRWTMATPFASQIMRLYFAYITTAIASGDFVLEVYTNTLSNYTGTYTKVALDSDVAGVSALAAGTSFYESTFVADASLIYYEIRFVRVTTDATAINLAAVTVSPMLVSYNLGSAAAKSLQINATGGSGFVELAEQASSPSTPASGFGRIYPKSDNKLYYKDDAGVETQLGGSGIGEINVIENPSDSSNWGVSSATVTTTTTAANLPLGPLVDTAIEISSSTNGGYAQYRWTMPVALRQRKLKVAFQQIAATLASGDYKVEVYKNSASDYSGTYTEFSLSTDSSGTSSLPNLNGQYQTTFDADDGIYYEIRIVRTAASSATIRLAGVIVGPGIQPQGAVVGEWLSYTPTGPWTANTTYTGKYRRVGDSIELVVDLAMSGAPTSASLSFTEAQILNGLSLNVDSTKFPISSDFAAPVGTWSALDSAVSGNYGGHVSWDGSNAFAAYPNGSNTAQIVNATSPITFGSADNVSLRMVLPISQWAGSGTVQLAQNDVEYAFNTDTSNADNTTSFGYGPMGVLFPTTSTTNRNKRVRFQRPIQSSDILVLEYSSDQVTWAPLSSGGSTTTVDIDSFNPTNDVGAAIVAPVSSTDVDIKFRRYRIGTTNWSGAGGYWRVRKSSAGAAVGFGIVVPGTSSGLVSASGLPGNTTGSAIAAGYVGETQTASMNNTTLTGTTVETDVTGASITLGAGVWLVSYSVSLGLSAAASVGGESTLSVYLTDSSNVKVSGLDRSIAMRSVSTNSNLLIAPVSASTVLNLSSSTTYKLRGQISNASGTAVGGVIYTSTSQFQGNFFAVRIA